MILEFCPDCNRYHAEGLCSENIRQPAQSHPTSRTRLSLTEGMDHWTAIYEKHLTEFATETGGVPTKAHVRRAEQLADREIKEMFA